MILTLDIPDDVSRDAEAKFNNLNGVALEALAADWYQKDALSVEQVRRMLGLESKWEAQAVLSRRGVWPGLSADDVMRDAAAAAAFSLLKPLTK